MKAPRTWPNNALSSNVGGRAPHCTTTIGLSCRGDQRWISRAREVLPVPVSPVSRSVRIQGGDRPRLRDKLFHGRRCADEAVDAGNALLAGFTCARPQAARNDRPAVARSISSARWERSMGRVKHSKCLQFHETTSGSAGSSESLKTTTGERAGRLRVRAQKLRQLAAVGGIGRVRDDHAHVTALQPRGGAPQFPAAVSRRQPPMPSTMPLSVFSKAVSCPT